MVCGKSVLLSPPGGGGEGARWGFSYRGATPLVWLHPRDLTPSQSPSPNTITRGLRFQYLNSEGTRAFRLWCHMYIYIPLVFSYVIGVCGPLLSTSTVIITMNQMARTGQNKGTPG